MGVKVQYNPSTGKVSYNPATGKVQVVVDADCEFCDVTPNQIQVTFSSVTIADGCFTCTVPSTADKKFTGIPDINTTFTLTNTAPTLPCSWIYTEAISGTIENYSSTDGSCTGLLSTINLDLLTVRVNSLSSGRAFVFVAMNTGATIQPFRATSPGGYVVDDGCVGITTVNNQNTLANCGPAWDGSASVVEI